MMNIKRIIWIIIFAIAFFIMVLSVYWLLTIFGSKYITRLK